MRTFLYPPTPVSVSVPPVAFYRDGVATNVSEDTSTPSNSRPLPAGLYIIKDGVITPVLKDTGIPSNTVGIPVEMVAASGTPINITAGDINVQLSDQGVNYDSTRIGDGTNLLVVNADGSIKVENIDAVVAALGTLNSVDFATEAKQDNIITAIGNLLTELQLKADLTETQPVSAASLPLPTGAASESTLNTLASKDFATASKQDSQATLTGAVTESAPATDTASSGLNGRLQRIAQRISSLISLLPGSLGQKTMAASLAVTLASDQAAIPVTTTEVPLTITYQEITNLTNVAQTFVAPAGTKWMLIETDEVNGANVRVKIGAVATVASGIQFQPGRSEMLKGGGNISVIAESGVNNKVYVQFGA